MDDAGLVQVEGAYYAALPAAPRSTVTVRLYAHEIEIRDAAGGVLRRHEKAPRKGQFVLADTDRAHASLVRGAGDDALVATLVLHGLEDRLIVPAKFRDAVAREAKPL